jgi:hypothetical protein
MQKLWVQGVNVQFWIRHKIIVDERFDELPHKNRLTQTLPPAGTGDCAKSIRKDAFHPLNLVLYYAQIQIEGHDSKS